MTLFETCAKNDMHLCIWTYGAVLFCRYLLAELLQVGDDAVTQAAVHGVRNEVGRAHHPHGLFQGLGKGQGRGKIGLE